MKSLLLLLLAAPASAATWSRYDPDADRFAFKGAGNACYTAANAAYMLPLSADKAADIRADLDEAVRQAAVAADAARRLDGGAQGRVADMKGALKDAAGDVPAAPGDARARWKTLSGERADLSRRVDAMPDKNPDGSPSDKPRLQDELSRAESALKSADGDLTAVEGAAKDGAAAAAAMKASLAKAVGDFPYGELLAADSEGLDAAGRLPGTADEAKALVGQIDVEPKNQGRQRASDKLDQAREQARRLFNAGDRASNRADFFSGRCAEFDRAYVALKAAVKTAGDRPYAVKSALDGAERLLTDVRNRVH